jgi:hypothetical protein
MNLRQSVLVTSFCGTLFMNFASIYWNMWSVASISIFVLMITDFMFFEVRAAPLRLLLLLLLIQTPRSFCHLALLWPLLHGPRSMLSPASF